MAPTIETRKPDRAHVDPKQHPVIRHLMKISGKPKADVPAAIKEVGTNISTAEKELGCVDS